MTLDQKAKQAAERLRQLLKVKSEGYAGITKEGTLVDRREVPDAMPIPENEYLGIPAPKQLPVPPKK